MTTASSRANNVGASTKVSLLSLAQYALFALFGYIFAGAPLLSILRSPSSSGTSGATAGSASGAGPASTSLLLERLAIPDPGLQCPEHRFTGVHVLRTEPLVVYIEGFLSEAEGEEVLASSTPHFTPSTIWTSGIESFNPLIRNSEKAPLPRSQTTQCIESRAQAFQGWNPNLFTEKLWAQRYGPGGHYTYHYDWSMASSRAGRISSFMVYVEANCTGGGTHFPRIETPRTGKWCEFVDCEGNMEGTVFLPRKGNAVFWENMRDGRGFEETWHAGLPVKQGTKVGLNIWTWLQEGFVPEV